MPTSKVEKLNTHTIHTVVSNTPPVQTVSSLSLNGEVDPVFRNSVAYNITQADIERWDTGSGIDLSAYTTKAELVAQAYITSDALNEMSYVSHDFLSSQAYLTTELEPAFNASPAANISQEQIDSWDSGSSVDLSAYVQKSELSAQAYITSAALDGMSYVSHEFLSSQAYIQTETEPAFNSSPASSITSTDISNWNNASGSLDMSAYTTKVELVAQSYVTSAQLVNCGYVSQNDIVFPDYQNTYQAKGNYLTEEQDPIFSASPAAGITQEQIDSWDSGSSVDLSAYVQKSELSAQSYITSDVLNAMSYVSHEFLSSQAYLTSEVEPAFNSSPASSITSTDISNWNNAAGTLDMSAYCTKAELAAQSYITATTLDSCGYLTSDVLSSQGYITGNVLSSQSYITQQVLSEQSYLTVEVEPAFNASPAATITAEDITRWDSGGGDLSLYVQKSELSEQAYITPAQLYSMSYITQSDIVFPDYSATYQSIGDYVTKSQLSDQSYVQFSSVTENTRRIEYPGLLSVNSKMNQNTYTGTPIVSSVTINTQDRHNVCSAGIQSTISYTGTSYNVTTNFSANIAPGFNGTSSAQLAADRVDLIPGEMLTIRDNTNYTYQCNITFNPYTGTLQFFEPNGISLNYKGAHSFIASYDYVLEQMNDFVVSQAYITPSALAAMAYVSQNDIVFPDYQNTYQAKGDYVTPTQLVSQSYITINDVTFPDYSNTYQAKGDYITQSVLDAQSYVTTATLAAQSYITLSDVVFPDYSNTYQAKGDYITPTILNNQAYVTAAQLYAQSYVTQNSIVFPDYSNTYQAKGDYISQNYLDNASYITQTTLDNCGYAMVRLVTEAQYEDRQDDILYVITDADPINASNYTTYAYTFANYTSYSYINNRIDTDLVTKAELTAILANYMPKPDIIYETDGTTGLLGENASSLNITSNWQLENVDFSGYRYVLAFIKQADLPISGTNNQYITPALVVYIPLDAASRSTQYDAYVGSTGGTNMNDPDVHFIVQCAIDSTKTKFKVVNEGSVAGTIWGDRNNNGRYCYKIEGYK